MDPKLYEELEHWARLSMKDGKFYKGLQDALDAIDKARKNEKKS